MREKDKNLGQPRDSDSLIQMLDRDMVDSFMVTELWPIKNKSKGKPRREEYHPMVQSRSTRMN